MVAPRDQRAWQSQRKDGLKLRAREWLNGEILLGKQELLLKEGLVNQDKKVDGTEDHDKLII
jgi:hypothetical protein